MDTLLDQLRTTDLHALLSTLRLELGLNQTELAQRLGIHRRPSISNWETGERPVPPGYLASLIELFVVEVLSNRTGITPEQLIQFRQLLLETANRVLAPRQRALFTNWRPPFRDWADLATTAAAFRQAYSTRPASARTSQVPGTHTPTPLPPPFRVPYHRNRAFVGREELLQTLQMVLTAAEPPDASIALVGMGGIGKTQLAIEAAYRFRPSFPGGIFWISMADPENVAAEIAACGGPDGLRLPGWQPHDQARNVAAVWAAWQADIARLLIFDNLEDPHLLERWCPKVGGCRVLITTRRPAWSRRTGVQVIRLESLSPEESAQLLIGSRVTSELPEAEIEAAEAICTLLGRLPLALGLAGAYLELHPQLTLQTYCERLKRIDVVVDPSLNLVLDEQLPTGHSTSILATFTMSLTRLLENSKDSDLALRILQRVAHLAPAPIPQQLLLPVANLNTGDRRDMERYDPSMRQLEQSGLLERLPGGSIRMHRLIASFIRSRMPIDPSGRRAIETAIAGVLESIIHAGYPLDGLPLLDHARHILAEAAGRTDTTVVSLCNNLATLLQMQGEYAAARPLYERSLQIYTQLFGAEHPQISAILNNLGGLLRAEGRYAEATHYYRRALELCEQLFGTEHPQTALCLNNLGAILYYQGAFTEARGLLERALHIQEQAGHGGEQDLANTLNNLAAVTGALGEYSPADLLYERALQIYRRCFERNHPGIAATFANRAVLWYRQGEYQKARTLFEHALALQKQGLGHQHPEVARSLNNIGTILRAIGEYATALTYHRQALQIAERVQGEDHPDTRIYRRNLGFALLALPTCGASDMYMLCRRAAEAASPLMDSGSSGQRSELAGCLMQITAWAEQNWPDNAAWRECCRKLHNCARRLNR